jgi:hypothetical protein
MPPVGQTIGQLSSNFVAMGTHNPLVSNNNPMMLPYQTFLGSSHGLPNFNFNNKNNNTISSHNNNNNNNNIVTL